MPKKKTMKKSETEQRVYLNDFLNNPLHLNDLLNHHWHGNRNFHPHNFLHEFFNQHLTITCKGRAGGSQMIDASPETFPTVINATERFNTHSISERRPPESANTAKGPSKKESEEKLRLPWGGGRTW